MIQLAAQPREQPGFHHRSSDSLADPPPFLASVSVASCRLTCLTLAATKRIRPRSGRPRGTWNRGKLRAQTGAVRVCVCVRVCAWAGRACEGEKPKLQATEDTRGNTRGNLPGSLPGSLHGNLPGSRRGKEHHEHRHEHRNIDRDRGKEHHEHRNIDRDSEGSETPVIPEPGTGTCP